MGKMNRNRVSIFNAISAIMLTMVNGLLGIVVTKLIIFKYGSDFNGLNSTANQLVNVLLIVEGGFTLASNVALFQPLVSKNLQKVNRLLSLTREKFRKIGIIFFSMGFIISIFYTFFVNSNLPVELIFTVIFMTIIPAAFNLFYATTYRVLLQAQQKEYVINFITMFTLGLGHIGNIVLVYMDGSIWLVRTITMATALLNSVLIVRYVKKKNIFLDLKKYDNEEIIKGTGDVMIQKITGMIYNSAPIIFLSISPSAGTVLASIYAVYNNIFNMIKSLMRSIIDAPRLSIGQLLTETNRENVWFIFLQYEYIVFLTIFVTINTSFVLILPFISIYTQGIVDANYYDVNIALLMTWIAVFELIHIPSGHLINMAAEFKISRNIQTISCIILICLMIILEPRWGIYGLLYAILLVSILLSILEIGYIHIIFFKNRLVELLKLLIPLFLVGIVASWIEKLIFSNINGVIEFIISGIILVVINAILAIIVGMIFNKDVFWGLFQRIIKLVKC